MKPSIDLKTIVLVAAAFGVGTLVGRVSAPEPVTPEAPTRPAPFKIHDTCDDRMLPDGYTPCGNQVYDGGLSGTYALQKSIW